MPTTNGQNRQPPISLLAMSKKGKCFFALTISLSSLHCASVGSTPVGFYSA